MTPTPTDLETHGVPADVDPENWSLSVTGAVERPLELDQTDFHSLDHRSTVTDFACVEGWTAKDLVWEGVRVGDLLTEARPASDAAFGLAGAMDGDYACSFTLNRLKNCLLATRLDREILPTEHGGPARLVPLEEQKDCWEHVKWVSQIELYRREPTEADTAHDLALSRNG
ncbi:molybdopterin-dependent oxidoreductase [Halococcus sp. AFM35]|uniref:molybdopterin-dependent oxidoreductase n=1 Tax=Halococcus sp. AFM35 TaxID=3421653 RepID=UPI003EBFA5E5